MNKHLYRIVFNKARGLLMVVAETVTGTGKTPGTTRAPARDAGIVATLRPIGFSLLLAGGLVAPLVQAHVVADPSAPGPQRPTILNAGNGVPLINIQTPSAAGVSRNTYSQFDVDRQGVILNNARTSAPTQLGGWVTGNPWLATGTARVILNEVNASNPSLLNGYVEVAGSRAQVVIANPAGISCDGCGFINANRATLTTGAPILNGGSLDGYRVQQGAITVSGAGLDASRTDFTDLIARSLQVNAGIWANNLTVSTGANQVSADHTQITPIAGSGAAPAYAIDVASLGGMYAGKIALISTESGVGVRNAGQIGARAGEVVVTVDGRLENSGQIASTAATRLSASGGLDNTGVIAAQGDLVANGGTLRNAGQIVTAQALSLSGSALDNRGGQIQAQGDATLDVGAGLLDNTGSLIRSNGTLRLGAGQVVNANTQGTDLGIEAQAVAITADQIDNQTGALRADTTLALTGSGRLDNTQGLISSGQNLSVQDRDLTNKTLAITHTGGTLIAGQQLSIDSASLSGDGQLLSQGNLSLNLASDFTNTGTVQADGNATLVSAGTVTNHSALQAGGTLAVSARHIDNQATGEISATQTALNAAGTLTNRGLIDGSETVVTAQTVNNLGTGRLYGDHVAIAATTVNNDVENGSAATIAARDRLDLGVRTLTNREHGLIFSAGDMAIGGALDTDRHATGSADTVNNNSARIEALGDLTIAAATINNTNEHFSTAVLPVGSPEHIVEYQGAGSPNRYTPGTEGVYIYNDESDHLMTPEGSFESWTKYEYDRTTTATTITASDPASITAGGAMRLSADTLLNDKSQIVAGGALEGDIQNLQNTEVSGQQTVTDAGSATSYWRQHEKGRDSTGSSAASYTPPAVISEIRLTPTVYQANTAPAGSGTAIATRTLANPTGSAAGATPITLPDSSLFHLNPDPTARYLVETDPRFANYRTWLSSDYLLQQLAIDPATLHKRLGDGFYEQKLIREQVAQLTGRRFLDGYASDEAQYRALIDKGVTYAKEWNLRPGVALTAAQTAQLTSDIVWLVEQDVTLPNGQVTQALVPQVYVRVKDGDLDGSGALLSGGSVNLNLTGNLVNQGTIAGRQVVAITADNVENLGGRITGNDVAVQARTNLNNVGGVIDGANRLTVTAGRDLNVTSTTHSNANSQGSVTHLSRVAGLYVTHPDGGMLVAAAGRDLTLAGAQVGNAAKEGQTVLAAGNSLNLGTVDTSRQQNIAWDSKNHRSDSTRQEVGTSIQTAGDLRLSAANDLNARGASVTSDQGAIVATAGHDVNLTAAETTRMVDESHQHKGKSSWLASKTITTNDSIRETTTQGTTLSGNTTYVQAGNDINVKGSNVVSTEGTTLAAGNDVNIEAAVNATTERHFKDEKKSGLFSGGGIGFTIGTQQQSQDNRDTRTVAAASTVGSTNGNVAISAGNDYQQVGSTVAAPQGDIDIRARKVDIVEAQETSHATQETKFRQSGLTVAVTAPVIAAIQTAQQMKSAAGQTSDARMQALAGTTTALAAKNAADAVAADPKSGGGVGISITVGGSKSDSTLTQDASIAAGSTVAAGGDVNIRASGAGKDSTLTVQGSNISAGQDATLKADGDIALLAAQNTSEMDRKSSSMSGGVGVAIQVGSNGMAFGITANASASRGKGEGKDVAWTNTHVTAGDQLTLESGGDTNLKGAVASGKQVAADVGGNLNIESRQDTHTYKSKDQSIGGSVTVGVGFSGSASASQQKIDSDFASVTEQSGIKAGDGGFQVDVKGNTDLKGGVIASTDKAVQDGKNSLTTGTLTHSDIQNHASYKASSIGIGGGYSFGGSSGNNSSGDKGTSVDGVGTNQQGQATTGGDKVPGSNLPASGNWSATPPIVMSASGSGSTTTVSGISGGAIQITDGEKQKALTGQDAGQTVASVNRSVSSDRDSTNALKPIFNEQEIKAGFEIVGALQRETGTFLSNRAREVDQKNAQAKEADVKAADLSNGLTDEQRLALRDQASALRTEAQAINDKWGAGGTYRQITTALMAGAGGNVTGSTAQFAQNMVINYVQQQGAGYIGKLVADGTLTEGRPAHAALHAIVACAGAAASNQSCSSGALGAASSSLLTGLFNETSPDETASQREGKRNLITSLVTGIAAMSGADATTATNSAIVAVDNNWLATQQIVQMKKELSNAKSALEHFKVASKWAYISTKQDVLTTAGIGKGLAESGWNDVKGVAEFLARPIDGLNGLKRLISSPEARQQLGDALFKELDAKIDRMSRAINEGGDANAEQLGKDLGGLLWQVGSVVTGAGGIAKGGVALAKVGVKMTTEGLEILAGVAKFDRLLASGGLFAADGKPLMDFRGLTNAQKSVVGELLGTEKIKQLVPGAQKIGRTPGIGETGIDDLYKVNKPGVDYIVVEYKFGSSALKQTKDGLQMSDGWLTGSNTQYDRILEAVNNDLALTKRVKNSLDSGRVERWLVHTDPYGNVSVGILDKSGKLLPDSKGISKVLGGGR